ncbi:hypothetical protein ACVIHH_000902 [Bradyrhizobium sp. USDA 4518]|uniref:hypothetical protein n=1 Tax=Bradyrhizobium brasilense TaxID=1419277 RepID=UPI001456B989|nr:hypothetical protein [Bradyrhizobium brasilense]NLS75140.1 hypothetical protein [Bradyrhizobium brasilense]
MQVNEFEFIASGEFSDPLRKGGKTLWFYCNLVYLDFIQVRRESGFCWRRVDNPNTHGYFVADAAPAYNQKT